MDEKTVLVLGAGFTRALVPTAPLIIGDWGVPALCTEFAGLPNAKRVLSETLRPGSPNVDLEQLLTRLVGMPYDSRDAGHEFALVTSRLLKVVDEKLKEAKAAGIRGPLREAFAKLVIERGASIVTFNYDDVVDEGLYELTKHMSGPRSWHPDGGYGFFCRPARSTVVDTPIFMNECDTWLLKLHGSLNWRSALGSPSARPPDQILHYETWFTEREPTHLVTENVLARIPEYLEPDPLIVPPVLTKSELTLHPVLRLVWSRAREKLEQATKVVFLGYSVPITDLAAGTLFQETLTHRTGVSVEVINYTHGRMAADVRQKYRRLLDPIDPKFYFDGAEAWIDRNTPTPAISTPAVAAGGPA